MPSTEGSAPPVARRLATGGWTTNAWLFAATVASVFYTYWDQTLPWRDAASHAGQFTGALLAILLAHEFGHYIAARLHKVDATLPFFLPMPVLSPFGTMGAVIRMRTTIPSRRALLDIGAAGPLAGLALALPLYAWGLRHCQVVPQEVSDASLQLGDSAITLILGHFFAPQVPAGSDLFLSPVAEAAWAGMFVTMLNLIPLGQLDGGHVAYALFGRRQNRIAPWVHRSVLAFFFVSLGSFLLRDLRTGIGFWHFGKEVNRALAWLVLFEILAIVGTFAQPRETTAAVASPLDLRTRGFATLGLAVLAGAFEDRTSPLFWAGWLTGLALLLVMEFRWGALRPESTVAHHPETGDGPDGGTLALGRTLVAILTLAFFALLFMPTPISM